jgi:hypothetical protein
MKVQLRRIGLVLALAAILVGSIFAPLSAQNNPNFVQRHPTASAIAAGAGTTYYLKHRAKWKKEHGEKLNFAERHPYLSGFGVAVVTHHMIKKTTKHEPQ